MRPSHVVDLRTSSLGRAGLRWLGALALGACSAEDAPEGHDPIELRDDEPGLDEAPHRIVVDPEEVDYHLRTTIDLAELEPQLPHTVFMHSRSPLDLPMIHHPETGALLAKGKPLAYFNGQEGPIYMSGVALPPGISVLDVVADLHDAYPVTFLLCDAMVDVPWNSGPGSLRHGIDTVRDGGSVCFHPRVFANGGQVGLNTQIVATDVHVHGLPSRPIVQPTGSTRLFSVEGGQSSLHELTLRDGNSQDGGLIKIGFFSSLDIEDSDLINGTATDGGAIYNDAGSLKLRRSSISESVAIHGGGAVYSLGGEVSIEDSQIFENEALEGGGVYTKEVCTFELGQHADVSWNQATRGGGIYVGSLLFNPNCNAIAGGVVHDNEAVQGGGLYVDYAVLEIRSGGGEPGIISGNAAEDGGGIYILEGAVDVDDASEVSGNTAAYNGGGVYNYVGSLRILSEMARIESNLAVAGDGGGLFSIAGHNNYPPGTIVNNTPNDVVEM